MSGAGYLPDPVRSTGRHRWPRTLNARLTTGVVALVALLVLVTGGGTWLALRAFLSARLDQQVESAANGSPGMLFNGSPGASPGVRAPQDIWAVAIRAHPELTVYPRTGYVEALRLALPDRQRVLEHHASTPMTVETTDGRELRVTTRTVNGVVLASGEQIDLVAVIGLSTDEEHRTLSRLVTLELLIGAAAVVLAFAATSYGVRFSLRRLRRVTTTAQEVAAELSPEGAGLDRRVPDDEPESEVGQLATSFNTLLGAVEAQFAARLESEQRMRQFLADASHELRTPLTSIRGYAELARMQRAVGGTQDDNLSRIESEGTRMSRLVEDLLMLARGGADGRAADRELIDVAELLDDAVGGVRAAFPERVIDIQLVAAPHVVGDRDQLVRVVRNLVTNAAVHTRPDHPVLVRAHADEHGVTIQVIDGGPGLPPDEAAHVFERFWRADKARTRARGGSGLGLSIASSIVRSHGGTVHFASTVEGGSTVTIWLPGAQPA